MKSADADVREANSLRTAVDDLCRRFALAELYVFGSRAREILGRLRGDADLQVSAVSDAAVRAASDVDMGVRPLPGEVLDVDALVDLAAELEGLFGAPRVDVVLLPTAKAFLALEVVRGELIYCADPDAQAEYELYVLRRAGDLAPFQRFRQELALSRYSGEGDKDHR